MGDGEPEGDEAVDYRFTLANERTFLAWIRTALALLAGAVAVLHLLPLGWNEVARTAMGLTLAVLAGAVTVYAPVRWYRVQRAMYRGEPLPMSVMPLLTAFAVGLVCLVVLLGNLL